LENFALPPEAAAILVALGAGLLIGIERERRMETEQRPAAAHSTSASVGSLAAQGQMPRDLAMIAVGLVVTTNTIAKIVFARAGGSGYFLRLLPGLLLLVAAFWVTWWLLYR
jgi:hypothetical protein